ncbi:hypothetical protein RHSIM_Rhsim12G0202900 [Rhododendron simsii]|uniref:Uncharacterized protein n=1 Tax=Rhododendron simsii TaxID=118357 RepID=A0A834G3G7_RHOSS|nr:hypothetical protein RHSIM_Rhsim12G0202900 [Rhododendron simsii]
MEEDHSQNQKSGHAEEDKEALNWAALEKLPTYASLFRVPEEDNEKFLKKFRNRIEKFENLTIEADCYIGDRALPTLPNTALNIAESALSLVGIRLAKRTKVIILRDASGIIKPSRMTLLLGPPSSGKTTLLLALAEKLDPTLKARLTRIPPP